MQQVKLLSSALLFALTSSVALAQNTTAPSQETTGAINRAADQNVALVDPRAEQVPAVSPDQLYSGWRAEWLFDQEVYGPNGNVLGEIEDLIINADGQIEAIVVEGGGFLEIGDARFRIPWNQVTARPGGGVVVPLTEERAEEFNLYDTGDWVPVGPREFRVREVIGDRVVLRNGLSYGYVDDAVFNRDGKLIAVLVNSASRPYGVYAYPWYGYGYGWDPGLSYYALPVTDITASQGFANVEVGRFNQNPFAAAG